MPSEIQLQLSRHINCIVQTRKKEKIVNVGNFRSQNIIIKLLGNNFEPIKLYKIERNFLPGSRVSYSRM